MVAEVAYAYFDGDDIGRRLELLLLDDKVDAAAHYSRLVEEARHALVKAMMVHPTAEVIFSGGDDLLVRFDPRFVELAKLTLACSEFSAVCGQGVSVGVGATPAVATANLRRAKLAGKGRIVSEGGRPVCGAP